MFKQLHPNIRIRIYTSFLSRIIGSMIFPFMAIYFTNKINATIAGILLLFNVIVQFIAGFYGGYLADLVGRKQLMVIGEAMKLFAFIGMIAFNSPLLTSAIGTFIMMLIISVASGFINPAAEAMLIDVSTKETRAFMYSVNYWANNLSMMIGLMVGGWLFKSHFFELNIGLAIMSMITLWMTASLIQETFKPTNVVRKEDYGLFQVFKSYRTVMRDVPFLLFTLGGIAILSLEFQRSNYIAVRLEQEINPRVYTLFDTISFHMDGVRLVSLLTVENTLFIVLFTALVTKLISGKKEQLIMYVGFALFGLGFAILAFSNSFLVLFVAVVILSTGELMYVPTRQSLLADIVDDSKRGAYMAFNGFVFQIGKMIGAMGIIVGEAIGGVSMAILYMVLVIIGIAFSYLAVQRRFGQIGTKPEPKQAT